MAVAGKKRNFGTYFRKIPKLHLNVPERGGEVGGGTHGRRRIRHALHIYSIPKKSKNYDFTPFFFNFLQNSTHSTFSPG